MFTQKHFPTFISGEELDKYLERGWFRMGQAVFTCHFLFFEENLYSPIWMRLPLEGYVFRKNLRRVLAKNERRFRTFIRPANLDQEKEELFERYRLHFKGRLDPNLKINMFDNSETNIFSSYEIAVYDGEKLVAFSFFDVGKSSIASIKGVYDH
ncbi:MAG: arginine-tRNA-protein transferase, partial [Bacteroidota bacterium]